MARLVRYKRLLLAAGAGYAFVFASPVLAQTTGNIGVSTDKPGTQGPAGPAGQAGPSGGSGSTTRSARRNPAAGGTTGLTEVVVTAERRSSSVQRIAAAVSVRTGDELRKEGKFAIQDILENVPGVSQGNPNAVQSAVGGSDEAGSGITIRGLSSNSGAGGSVVSVASAVAVYTDDIYEGIGSNYDLDRVEVLRGPQGTLYGRSSTAGVVSVHTHDPDLSHFGGLELAEAGSDGLLHFTSALNVPIIKDELAIRLAGDFYHINGFDDSNGAGRVTSKNGRVKILERPSNDLSILVGGAIQNNDTKSGGRTPGLDVDGQPVFSDVAIGHGQNHYREAWADVQYNFGAATLTYIPAYRSYYENNLNTAQTPNFVITQPSVIPKDQFVTNEVRLASNGVSRFKWQVGFLDYYNSVNATNAVIAEPGNLLQFQTVVTKQTNAEGVFGEATYSLTSKWRVTGGLRYDHTRVAVDEAFTGPTGATLTLSGADGTRRFNDLTYKIRTEYDVTPRNLVYASYSTGFSPGDVSATTSVTGLPEVLILNDETLRSAEIGSKNRFLDNTLQVNGSAFYYYYTGYQNQGINIAPPPFVGSATLVSPQRAFGGELEVIYQPTYQDRISLEMAYVHARYVNSSALFSEFIANSSTPGVAPYTASLSYSHRFDLPGGSSFTFTGEGRYLSSHLGGTITQAQVQLGGLSLLRVPDTGVGDLTGTWTSPNGKFSLGGYVRNISDNRYALNSGLTENFFDTAITGSTLVLYQPRTFGFVSTLNF